ncbi:MAG: dihydropteroate synthase, partial [Caulobacteraceae bacterium]|nr:dihydropteroate synthase [Caulobacteraceae bacterium]
MGIVNATPDSFSDGGRFADLDAGVAGALRLIAEGADWLDVGGESTRPGATPVAEAEEMARVVPLIAAIRAAAAIPISVDTMKPSVAQAAMAAGATMWNDVTALSGAPGSLDTAVKLGCDIVLTHMRGEPATMQQDPRYEDVVEEVVEFLGARAEAAETAGVARGRIWVDPGIGFGKTADHSLALLSALGRIADLGFPVLLGASRKGVIRAVDPMAIGPGDRLGGSLAAALAGARAGAAMVRV